MQVHSTPFRSCDAAPILLDRNGCWGFASVQSVRVSGVGPYRPLANQSWPDFVYGIITYSAHITSLDEKTKVLAIGALTTF